MFSERVVSVRRPLEGCGGRARTGSINLIRKRRRIRDSKAERGRRRVLGTQNWRKTPAKIELKFRVLMVSRYSPLKPQSLRK